MPDTRNNSEAVTYSQGRPATRPDPKDKLNRLGAHALSSTDLLSIVLGSSTAAEALLRRHGLGGLTRLPKDKWRQQRGIGVAGAARMSAVFELGRRAYRTDADRERPKVSRPAEAFKQAKHLTRHKKEHLFGLYLDAQNGLVHKETISMGSLNTTRTHPREILHPAVIHFALGFILAHNHPSGCLDPSPEDIEFTRAIQRAGDLM